MDTVYTVSLADGTCGTLDSDTLGGQSPTAFIGEVVTVKLQDENGMFIEVDGILVDVF